MGMKLRWRVAMVAAMGCAALIFVIMTSVLSSSNELAAARSDLLYRQGKSHLMMPRVLVDKSSWLSNHSESPEYVFESPPKGMVNNVPDEVRRKFLFRSKPSVANDFSLDYVNKVYMSSRRDPMLFTPKIYKMNEEQLIYHINAYRHKARRKGKKMDIFDESAIREISNQENTTTSNKNSTAIPFSERGNTLKHWEQWYLNISQYEVYRHDDPITDQILTDLANAPVVFSKQLSGGTQLKMRLSFINELEGLWKPMRYTRDTETLQNHYYFSDFERHHAEIAAFHLDRVFGFRRSPPVSGRILNITTDIEQYASSRFLKTMFYSPIGNKCFYGKCSYYCDSNHAICGHPDWLEGSVAAFLPPDDIAPREHRRNPWRRSYSRTKRAEWEDDQEYCEGVKHQPPFDEGRVLIDLIDLHIFDYVQANMDRHHYEVYDFPEDWKNDTTPVLLDNGRGWGKMYRDEPTILAPLYQCCQVRHSTLQKLLLFDEGPYKLSRLLDESTKRDPLYPILAPGHLKAADRRVRVVLKEIQICIAKNGWDQVVIDDGF